MKVNVPWLIACGADRVILIVAAFVAGALIAWLVLRKPVEGFDSGCSRCGTRPCACKLGNGNSSNDSECKRRRDDNDDDKYKCPTCPKCPPRPDMSKYVLRASVPPCPAMPDMSKYILKSEVPPLPDMSRYVLKSSVPKCPPCISSCSKPCSIGECPPCPRPRCPVPAPCPRTTCAPCPVVQPMRCPEPDVTCKPVLNYASADANRTPVRPVLASIGSFNF